MPSGGSANELGNSGRRSEAIGNGDERGENSSAAKLDRAPMIPSICHDPQFLYATDLQLEDHAANPLLAAQLIDSLKCWLSHIKDVYQSISEQETIWDTTELLSVVDAAAAVKRLESHTAFYLHFDRPEPKVVIRCLQHIPKAAPLLADLEKELVNLKVLNAEYQQAIDLLEMASSYFPKGEWPMTEISDAAGPLFSSLRALFLSSTTFGGKKSSRFLSLIYWVIRKTEVSIHDACGNCLKRILERPAVALQVASDLVSAQDASVSVQEAYHRLKLAIIDHSPNPAAAEELFMSVDDESLFAKLEWQFHRCTLLNHMVDALKKDENKIGSALTDRLEPLDLLEPSAIDQQMLMREVEDIVCKDAPNPSAVLERMGVKAQNADKALISQFAPRVPFEELTSTLCVNVIFNPPEVVIAGGPISEKTLDAMSKALPQCCSNRAVTSLRKVLAPCKWEKVLGHATSSGRHGPVVRMEVAEQFCDIDVAQSHFLSTLFDLIESEDAWSLTNCQAHVERGKHVHTFIFRRQRAWEDEDQEKRRSLTRTTQDAGAPTS
jgi:hypothetical protein